MAASFTPGGDCEQGSREGGREREGGRGREREGGRGREREGGREGGRGDGEGDCLQEGWGRLRGISQMFAFSLSSARLPLFTLSLSTHHSLTNIDILHSLRRMAAEVIQCLAHPLQLTLLFLNLDVELSGCVGVTHPHLN